ncbi:MAG: hypothetical protein O9302_08395 [Cyclobacteriaceae bacterium]|jgi:hypothetical protein|nr:hypothetical protein [Cytophagales bacterium]MCZ8328065.1 hypothetical protein [Cyclobacteriaceae bacterium]
MLAKNKAQSLLLLFLMLTVACEIEQDTKPEQGKFSLSFSGSSNAKTSEVFAPTAVLISIKNSKGEIVLDLQRLELYNFFGQFFTSDNAKLKLPVGEYQITDLLVVNAQNQVTHVVPKSGTPGAAGVVNVLPHKLFIKADEETKTTFVVTKVTKPAGEYGYATFEVVENVNLTGKLKEILIDEGSGLTNKAVYQYNDLGKVEKITSYYCYPIESKCSVISFTTLKYNQKGNIEELKSFDNGNLLTNSRAYTYDGYGRVSSVIQKTSSNQQSKTDYYYSDDNAKIPKYAETKNWPSSIGAFYRTEFSYSGGKEVEMKYIVSPNGDKKSFNRISYSYIDYPKNEFIGIFDMNDLLMQPLTSFLITELTYIHYDALGNVTYNCSISQKFSFTENISKLLERTVQNPESCLSSYMDGSIITYQYY